jgi:succinate dehydrogenase/fumarate reductase cytochrome b subunit
LVVIAGIYHGLNGIRIGITTFSKTTPVHKWMFYILMVITIISSLIFAIRMFTA